MIDTPGIYTISHEDYHADCCVEPSLSSSLIKVLCSSTPWHAKTEHPRLNPNLVREEKEIFDLGQVAHALMLQELDHACVLQFDDWRSKDARQMRADARAVGQVPILQKHWDRVRAMVTAGKEQVAKHREASDAFKDGDAEQTIVWQDAATDGTPVWCRARLDWLKKDRRRIFDYKSTGTSANPDALSRYMVSLGWDIQGCFYVRGLKKITGQDADFVFICQEDYPPYALSAIGLDPPFIWAGETKVQEAIDIFAKCMTTGIWSGYTDRIAYPTLPSFEETRITEKQLREA